MNCTFKKQYDAFAEEGLNPTEVCILTNIYNRYQLSVQHSDFFDRNQNDYYVIYTGKDLAKELNVSVSTIKREIKTLVKKHWLQIKRAFNRVNLIFIPQCRKPVMDDQSAQSKDVQADNSYAYDEVAPMLSSIDDALSESCQVKDSSNHGFNLTPSKSSICTPRKTNYKNTNNTYRYNSDTATDQNSVQNSTLTDSAKGQEESAKASVIAAMTFQGIPEQAAITIKAWSKDAKKMQQTKDLIFMAKKQAVINAEKQGVNVELTFENPNFPMQSFIKTVDTVMPKAARQARKANGYLYVSFLNFFEKTINQILKNKNNDAQENAGQPAAKPYIEKKLSDLGQKLVSKIKAGINDNSDSQGITYQPERKPMIPTTAWV